jgi:hypothetical protein
MIREKLGFHEKIVSDWIMIKRLQEELWKAAISGTLKSHQSDRRSKFAGRTSWPSFNDVNETDQFHFGMKFGELFRNVIEHLGMGKRRSDMVSSSAAVIAI